MEYLQYYKSKEHTTCIISFKPYYNWNTFNTLNKEYEQKVREVLNLIITGIPSIQKYVFLPRKKIERGFKPCYKWIAFNTEKYGILKRWRAGFKPYYNWNTFNTFSIWVCSIQDGI